MEKPPSGGCQLGDRSSNFETWADRAGAHEQEPMKSFEPRSMMQEHPQHLHVIKRASAHGERTYSWTVPARTFLKCFGDCCAVVSMRAFIVKRTCIVIVDRKAFI
jgi:hypothetical protein